MTVLDVAIVGGGPGGLALAVALHRACEGLKIKVYERRSHYNPCGAGLRLAVNGLKAIKAISPEAFALFDEKGVVLSSFNMYDSKGNLLKVNEYSSEGDMAKYGMQPVLVGWYEVLEEFASRLPEGSIQYSSKFAKYEETEDGLLLHFDGDEATPVTTKVLVGADGYWSRVRQQCLQDGPPDFSGTVVWRARVPRESPVLDTGNWYFGADRVALTYPINANTAVWTGSAPVDQLREAGLDPDSYVGNTSASPSERVAGSALERCLKVFADHAPIFVEVVKRTDPSVVTEHGVYTREADAMPDAGWGRGRVTLIGDAAHPMRPTGQGLNTTLEDVVELAAAVKTHGVTEEALRAYELKRTPRMKIITDHEGAEGRAAYKKDANEISSGSWGKADYAAFVDNIEFEPLS